MFQGFHVLWPVKSDLLYFPVCTVVQAVVAHLFAVHVGFVVDKMVTEHVLSKYIGFPW